MEATQGTQIMGRLKQEARGYENLSELLDRLGDIPPKRIRLNPWPGTATEQDVIQAEGRFNRLCELIDGTLVEKAMGFYESRVGGVLYHKIEDYLEVNDFGIVFTADAMMRVEPGQVRLPDVSFFSWDQFPNRRLPAGQILDRVPDLAVEVLSPSNTKNEMERKRREYLLNGCKLVWEVDPVKKTVRVYTAPDESKLIRERGTIEGGDVLLGFKLPVAELFARAGEREVPEVQP
jgi:Uma2 family endonuclease